MLGLLLLVLALPCAAAGPEIKPAVGLRSSLARLRPLMDPRDASAVIGPPSAQMTVELRRGERFLRRHDQKLAAHARLIKTLPAVLEPVVESLMLDLGAGDYPLPGQDEPPQRVTRVLKEISPILKTAPRIRFASPAKRPGLFEGRGASEPDRIAVTGNRPGSLIFFNREFLAKAAETSRVPTADTFLRYLGILAHEVGHHTGLEDPRSPSEGPRTLDDLGALLQRYATERLTSIDVRDPSTRELRARLFRLELAGETRVYYADGIHFKDLTLALRKGLARLGKVPAPGNREAPMSNALRLGALDVRYVDDRTFRVHAEIDSPFDIRALMPLGPRVSAELALRQERLPDGSYALEASRFDPRIAEVYLEPGKPDRAPGAPVARFKLEKESYRRDETICFKARVRRADLPGYRPGDQLLAGVTIPLAPGSGRLRPQLMRLTTHLFAEARQDGEDLVAAYVLPPDYPHDLPELWLTSLELLPKGEREEWGTQSIPAEFLSVIRFEGPAKAAPVPALAPLRTTLSLGSRSSSVEGGKLLRLKLRDHRDWKNVRGVFEFGPLPVDERILDLQILTRVAPRIQGQGAHVDLALNSLARMEGVQDYTSDELDRKLRVPGDPTRIRIERDLDVFRWNGEIVSDYALEGFMVTTNKLRSYFVRMPVQIRAEGSPPAEWKSVPQGLEALHSSAPADWQAP